MKASFESDSNEDLYYYTTTTDIFDFTTADTFVAAEVDFSNQTKGITRVFKSIFSIIKNTVFSLAKLIAEVFLFSAALLNYLRIKVLRFIKFLDVSKDQLVSGLMWRRGLIFRPATHGGVMVMAALAIVAGGLFSRGEIAAQDLTAQEAILKSSNTTETIVPTDRPRSEVITYKVIGGDTLSTVAEKFGVSVESIKWVNGMNDSETIHPEDTLKIPPITGVVHKVKSGETLESVAKKYSADKQTIADFPFNYIDETLTLKPEQVLYVPEGVMPKPAAPRTAPSTTRRATNFAVTGSGLFAWPTSGRISQYFSWFHPAIDIAGSYGTPVYAAAGGRVIDAKKQTYSFGWYCIIDHGNGYTSAYAHMSALACYVGQQVSRGQYLGAIGTTGRATGPHLHFEVRRNGAAVNPMSVL